MRVLRKMTGRLLGGLSRIARALRITATPNDVLWALMGGLIGAVAGWLFVAMWNR